MRNGLRKVCLFLGLVGMWALSTALPVEAQTSWGNGYAFRRAITIDHTKVRNTDQSNFPTLVSGTFSYLATVSNGGNVTNVNGYDIIFTSDAAGTTVLPFEQDSYSPTTGTMNYWVRVASLSHTSDTTIYMFYGNGSVTTDHSNKTAVWDSNFLGVWHLPNGSTLTANDSTSNGFNGTFNGATAAPGQIGGAANFNGSSTIPISTTGILSGAFTVELWAKPTVGGGVFGSRRPADSSFDMQISSTGVHGDIGNGSSWINTSADASFSYTTNTWHHFVYVVSTSGYQIYGDGSQIGSGSFSATPLLYDSNHKLTIGASNYLGPGITGAVDEVHLSNIGRSADWIGTEYNNQSSPGTFYSVSNPDVNGFTGSAPYIAGLWPTTGPVTTPVQILGANFGASQGSSTVAFNGLAGTPTVWNDSAIFVRVPTGASSGNVGITVAGMPSNSLVFTVNTAPGIVSISPQSGAIGTQVLITGVNFGAVQQDSFVSINGINAPVLNWSDTSVLVSVPFGASSGSFVVTVGGQTAASAFFSVGIPGGWSQQDIGAPAVAGSASFGAGTFSVHASGTDIGSSSDSFHFLYQPLNGDGTILARIVSLQGGGSFPKAGVMIRETLSAGSVHAYLAFQPGQIFFNYRATTGGGAATPSSVNANLPYWVKLVRSGNSFTKFASLDGVNWVQVGNAVSVNMAQSVYVGLAVTSQNNNTLGTAVFDNVSLSSTTTATPAISSVSATTGAVGSQVIISGINFGSSQGSSAVVLNDIAMTINSWSSTSITITIPTGATSGALVVSLAPSMNDSNPVEFEVTNQPLPQGFLNRDVGQVGSIGNSTYSNGLFDVVAAGSIGGTADTFHFIYEPISGDGSIVARVAYIAGVGYPQTGVTIRETLDSGSANAFLFYQPNQGFMYSRVSTGAGTTQQTVGLYPLLNTYYPYWVKLTRSGNTFSGYISMDGVYWMQIGSSVSITMGANAYIGLVASGNSGSTREGKFDNVSISSAASPAPAITNISATTGSIGNQITITGTGFGSAQGSGAIYLNDAPITVNAWTATSITATIPTGATTGYLGVAAGSGLNASNPVWFTVTSQPLPSGWLDRDMGQPGTIYPAGSAIYSNGTVTINTAGTGIGGTADAMHLVYQTLTGDGSIIARVSNKTSTYAGVLIRETLDPSSAGIFVNYYPNQAYLYSRTTTGAAIGGQGLGFSSPGYPYWVKATRSGNSFSGYISSDGVYWTQVGTTQTIQMAQTAYVALAAGYSSNGSLKLASFDNISSPAGPLLPAPVVTSATPTVVGPGYSVTIAGSNFGSTQGTSNVYFNGGLATSITSWSSTQIVALVPTTASSGPVTVVVGGVGSNTSVSINVFQPIITSLTPPAAGPGGTITINGSGFGATRSSGSFPAFNGVAAYTPYWTDTSITLTVPDTATSGPVTVTNSGIVSNGVQFTVLEPLAVTTISPSIGPAGTAVTITGAGFGPTQSNSTVDFYGTIATVTSWSDTQITAVVPAGAPSGPVDVTIAGNIGYGPSFTVTATLSLTDSLGNSTSYASALIGGVWVPTNTQGSGCSSCSLRGTIQNTYDGTGNVLTRTDELGRTTTYTYDMNNNVTSISVPIGNGTNATTSYTYNSFGEVLTTTDPLGNVTTNTYDTNGNLLTVTAPVPGTGASASVTHFAYDTKGQLSTITDPLSNTTAITYTSAGLIATITDALSNVTAYGYDSHGNRTSVTDALNHQTTFAYDAADRLTTITYPGGTTTTFGYDYRGRRTSVTDQNGKITTYAYDDADRLLTVTDPANNVTTYGYDTENNLTSIKDANNHTTSFAYDAFGRATQTTFPSGAVETYSYDAVGNLAGKTDRKNQSINYTYDQLNRLTLKTYPDSSTVNYTYDNDSRLTQVSDPTGTYRFTFDNMGRLSTTTTQYSFLTARSFTTAYSYDAASNRTGFTDPEGGSTAYVYDTLNRLQTLTAPAAISGGSFGFGYDPLSRRTSLTRPNAVNTAYGYDNLSRLLSVTHAKSGATLDGATYTVDNAGNRTAKTDLQAGATTNYGYDAIYQLLNATQGSTTESYSYDPVGNRLSSLGVPSYSYNQSNELSSTSNTTYGYDNNGNAITKNDSSGITTYAWDFENRLTTVTLPASGGTVSFNYDPFGRRIYKSSSSGTSIYAYDSDNLIEETNASGVVVARYSQSLEIDEPLAMLRSGISSFYNADGLGSVTSLCTATGALAQTYAYDSFGKQTTSSGSLTNSFQFTGREFDTETNLYYYRARYMDPSTGRFISEDPTSFSGGVDFYSYVGNSPVYWVDPLGLKEGSPSNLVKRGGIDKIARGLRGSQDYNFDKQKDNFPANTNKCNKFVCDVLNEAGTPMLFTPKGAAPRCARAGEIANPGWKPSCWRTLAVGEAPQPGDVAAFPLSGGGSAFSGHSGIITSDGNISAHANGVGQVPGQFGPNVPGIVFRRYTCD